MRTAALCLALATPLVSMAQAASLAAIPGLQQVRVWEVTSTWTEASFAAGDARLTQRLGGSSLTAASRDFGFFAGDENYDLFYSDANGSPNPSGGYLTIEANCGVPYNCHNIDAVALKISGVDHYATAVTHFTFGNAPNTPGSQLNILGPVDGSFTGLGDTIGLPADARLSVTVGFDSVPAAVPEPQTWALMALGMAGLGLRARRRR